jgi:gluconokinase
MTQGPNITPAAAMPPLVVALDVGSSAVRAALFDAAGRQVEGTLQRAALHWSSRPDGSVETEADGVVASVCGVLDRLVHDHRRLASAARLGAISTIFHSFVGVDAGRRAVTPLLSWADTSAAGTAEELRSRLDTAAALDRTGAPIHAGYWPARVARWRNAASVTAWAGLPELVLDRLVGRWLTGLSIAAGTGMLERRARRWDPVLLEALALDASRLPPLHDRLEPVASLRPDAVRRWPALTKVEWLAPIGDGACGNVGLGAVGPHAAGLMIGTSAAMRVLVAGHPPVPAGLFAYPLEGVGTLVGGALSEGGGTAGWWARLTGQPLDLLMAAAGASPAGRVPVLPHLEGERAPGYRSDARFVATGLRSEHRAADVLRGILEGVATGLSEVRDRLAPNLADTSRIVAGGGALAGSPIWRRIVCDALASPIEFSAVPEPSLRGAAVLALHAAGLMRLDTPAPIRSRLEPDPEGSAAMAALARRRRVLYASLYGVEPA